LDIFSPHTAGVTDPSLFGPCHGTDCPTCLHFD